MKSCTLAVDRCEERDVGELENVTQGWLDETQASLLGEWAYSQARRCLLVEEMIVGEEIAPVDYKFFVFNGLTSLIHMNVDRHGDYRLRPYTPAWEPMSHTSGHPLAPIVEAPRALEQMLDVASRLGKPFDFMRIDLYNVRDMVYLSEYTPYPNGGWFPGWPRTLELKLGAVWTLPAPVEC